MNLTIDLIEERADNRKAIEGRSRYQDIKSVTTELIRYDKSDCKIEILLLLGKKYVKRLITLDNLDRDHAEHALQVLNELIYDDPAGFRAKDNEKLTAKTIIIENKLYSLSLSSKYDVTTRDESYSKATGMFSKTDKVKTYNVDNKREFSKAFNPIDGISMEELLYKYMKWSKCNFKILSTCDTAKMKVFVKDVSNSSMLHKYEEGYLIELYNDDKEDTDDSKYWLIALKCKKDKLSKDDTIGDTDIHKLKDFILKEKVAKKAEVSYQDFIDNIGIISMEYNPDSKYYINEYCDILDKEKVYPAKGIFCSEGEQYGEKWIDLEQYEEYWANTLIYKMLDLIGKRLSNLDVKTIRARYKVHGEERYIVEVFGGKNGHGLWEDYLDDLSWLVRSLRGIEDVTQVSLLSIDSDIPDDVFKAYIVVSFNK